MKSKKAIHSEEMTDQTSLDLCLLDAWENQERKSAQMNWDRTGDIQLRSRRGSKLARALDGGGQGPGQGRNYGC
jgi:ADP-ribosylglycohydrolase